VRKRRAKASLSSKSKTRINPETEVLCPGFGPKCAAPVLKNPKKPALSLPVTGGRYASKRW